MAGLQFVHSMFLNVLNVGQSFSLAFYKKVLTKKAVIWEFLVQKIPEDQQFIIDKMSDAVCIQGNAIHQFDSLPNPQT